MRESDTKYDMVLSTMATKVTFQFAANNRIITWILHIFVPKVKQFLKVHIYKKKKGLSPFFFYLTKEKKDTAISSTSTPFSHSSLPSQNIRIYSTKMKIILQSRFKKYSMSLAVS